MTLHATARKHGDATIVECSGRLVLGEESAHLRKVVKDVLAASNRIVLDLGAVSYIDSSGLGTLAGLYATAKNGGGEIKLANLNTRMRLKTVQEECQRLREENVRLRAMVGIGHSHTSDPGSQVAIVPKLLSASRSGVTTPDSFSSVRRRLLSLHTSNIRLSQGLLISAGIGLKMIRPFNMFMLLSSVFQIRCLGTAPDGFSPMET